MEQRVLITCEGQPITCYGCNETVHQFRIVPIEGQHLPPPANNTYKHMGKNSNKWTKDETTRRRETREKGRERCPIGRAQNGHKKTPENEQKQNRQVSKQTTTKRSPKKLTVTKLQRRQTYPQKQQV